MPNVNVLSGDYLVSGSYFEVLGTGVVPNLITRPSLTLPENISYRGLKSYILAAGAPSSVTQPHGGTTPVIFSFPGTNAQLARDHYGWLYNPWSQSPDDYYNQNNTADILWNKQDGWGNLDRANELTYSEWSQVSDYTPIEENEYIAKVVSADKYFKVDFTSWNYDWTPEIYGWSAQITPLTLTQAITGVAISLNFQSEQKLADHYKNQFWTLYTGSSLTGPFLKFAGNNAEQYLSSGIIISSGTWLPNKIPGQTFFAKALIKPLDVQRKLDMICDSGSFALQSKEKIGIGLFSKDAKEKLHVRGGAVIDGNLTVLGGASLAGVSLGEGHLTGARGGDYTSILGGRSGVVDSSFSVLGGGLQNSLYGIWNVIGGGAGNLASGHRLTVTNGVENYIFGSGNSILGSSFSSIGIGYPTGGTTAARQAQASGGLIWEGNLHKNALNTIAGGFLTTIYKGAGNFSAASLRGYTDGYFNTNINGLDNRIYSVNSWGNSVLGGVGNVISKTQLVYTDQYGNASQKPSERPDGAESWDLPTLDELSLDPLTPLEVLNGLRGSNGWQPRYTAGNTILNGVFNKVTNCRFNFIPYGGFNQIAYCEHGDIGGNLNLVYGESWDNYGPRASYRGGDANSKDIFIRGHRNQIGVHERAVERLPDYYAPGANNFQFGASGVIIFGNDVSTTNNAVAIFSDSRNPFRTVKSNTFHVGYLNGISLGGLGVQINNDSAIANDLIYWMDSYRGTGGYFQNFYSNGNFNPPMYASDPQGNWTKAQAIRNIETGQQLTIGSRRPYGPVLQKIIPYLTSSSLKRPNYDEAYYDAGAYPDYWPENHGDFYDISGNNITEFRWDLTRGLGVNIGTLNSLHPAIITAAWPLSENSSDFGRPKIDTYQAGAIPILTGVGTITPTNSIAIGHRNQALYSDIIVGYQNSRLYQKVDKNIHDGPQYQGLAWAKKHTYSRQYTPAPSDGYTTIIGGYNTISGASTNVIGYGNNVTFSKGMSNIMGMNNEIYPMYFYYPWYQNIRDPYGYIRPVLGGWNNNLWAVQQTAELGNSNIIGNSNGFKTRMGDTSTINVLGNNNVGDDVTRVIVVGTSNYVTGLGTKVVGSRNIVVSRESQVIGDENYIQDGCKSVVLGSENIVTNVLLNQIDVYNENESVGNQFNSYNRKNLAPGLPDNYNIITPNDMVIIGKSNTTSELQRTSILGSHNLIEGGKLDFNGEGESNQIIGHNNYSDAVWYIQDYSILGNFNTWDGKTTNLIGSYNYIPASIDTNILGNNNYQKSGSRNSTIIGNDHYVETSDGGAFGTNAYEYNPGQISFSPMNHLKYSNTIGAGQHSASNYDLYGTAKAGAAQKTILTWHGIITGSAIQEIYLDGRTYSPNISSQELALSRAKIPNNRMWNGKLYISIANRGLTYVRNITRGFYIVNQNGVINASSLSTYGTVEDQVTVGSSHGAHGSIAWFNSNGDRLILNTVGMANQKLVYHVVAEFLDTYVPTTSEDIFGYRLASDGVTRLPVLT